MNQQELKEVLDYNEASGIFTWKVNLGKRSVCGLVAGTLQSDGCISIGYNYKIYKAHRLAFLYMTGSIPKTVDHKDGNRDNNQFSNLRPATSNQNAHNSRIPITNTSGYKGVHQVKSTGNYIAYITFNYNKIYLGTFYTKEAAAGRYNSEATKLFGEFAKLNTITFKKR